jgi:hypothetical protein
MLKGEAVEPVLLHIDSMKGVCGGYNLRYGRRAVGGGWGDRGREDGPSTDDIVFAMCDHVLNVHTCLFFPGSSHNPGSIFEHLRYYLHHEWQRLMDVTGNEETRPQEWRRMHGGDAALDPCFLNKPRKE